MKTNKLRPIPFGVLLIVFFYVFGAFVLLLGFVINPLGAGETITNAHGLSLEIGVELVLVVALLAFVQAYGLFSLSRWGFLLAIGYSLYIGFVSLQMGALNFALAGQLETQIYFGNLLWSAMVIFYLIYVRKDYFRVQPVIHSQRDAESH